MTKRRLVLLASVLTILLLGAWYSTTANSQPVQAQAAAVVPVGRFQISSFVLQSRETPGAYVVDTQTGEVFQVIGKGSPESVGSVARPQPMKK